MRKVHIEVVMMVKNEKKRFLVSLESIKKFADSLIIYDTGSTDNTIEIVTEFCKKNNILLRLKQGEFVDFSTSRNVSLEYADSFNDIDYVLLMDCNDELRNGDRLRKLAEKTLNEPSTGFLICQEWWSGQYEKYFNMRFVKTRQGWRYKGRVQEWMDNTKYKNDEDARNHGEFVWKVEPEDCILYQDRTQDDDKSQKRFSRDYELLLQDYKDDPSNERTVFYLAQTCSCLQNYDESFYYYKMRAHMGGFPEEVFHSYMRCGDISKALLHPWYDTIAWYLKAYDVYERVEPLLNIADYYRSQEKWLLCYTFANLACKLKYPEDLILYVDKYAYDYKRWHLMGIVGYYTGNYIEGREGALKAIETGLQKEVDINNLKFYDSQDEKSENLNTKIIINKNQLISLSIGYPVMPERYFKGPNSELEVALVLTCKILFSKLKIESFTMSSLPESLSSD